MVRLIPIEDRKTGRTVWTPDAPESCPCGFEGVLPPIWRGCPQCRVPCFQWRCPDCRAVQVDDEHVCRDGPLPASAQRGA